MSTKTSQKGATLILCLMMIAVCILLSSVLIENTVLEFKSNLNYLEKTEILNTAENALNHIQQQLSDLKHAPKSSAYCLTLDCIHSSRVVSDEELGSWVWWQQNAIAFPSRISQEVIYIFIQERDRQSPSEKSASVYYQVLIWSENRDNHSRAILKAVFSKDFEEAAKENIHPAIRISWQEFR